MAKLEEDVEFAVAVLLGVFQALTEFDDGVFVVSGLASPMIAANLWRSLRRCRGQVRCRDRLIAYACLRSRSARRISSIVQRCSG